MKMLLKIIIILFTLFLHCSFIVLITAAAADSQEEENDKKIKLNHQYQCDFSFVQTLHEKAAEAKARQENANSQVDRIRQEHRKISKNKFSFSHKRDAYESDEIYIPEPEEELAQMPEDELINRFLQLSEQPMTVSQLNHKWKRRFPESTPFTVACEKGHLDDVKFYLEEDRKKNKNNIFSFFSSIFGTSNALINQRGAISNGHPGYTCLIIAAFEEMGHVVEYLLEQPDIDIMVVDDDGWNALHHAAWTGKLDIEVVTNLVNHPNAKANEFINKQGEGGHTPLDVAFSWNKSDMRDDIIHLIKDKGGKRGYELKNFNSFIPRPVGYNQ